MTGPLDLATTSSFGSSDGAPAGDFAADLLMAAGLQPVSAAIDRARLLRIMNARRSEPAGGSEKSRAGTVAWPAACSCACLGSILSERPAAWPSLRPPAPGRRTRA